MKYLLLISVFFATSLKAQDVKIEKALFAGNYSSVIELINQQLEKGNDDPYLYRSLGAAYAGIYDYNNAAMAYEHALQLDNDNQEIIFQLAIVYDALNWNISAIDLLRQLYVLDTLQIHVKSRLANSLYKNSNYSDARDLYLEILIVDTTNYFFHKQVAKCGVKLKDNNLARKHYYKVITLNPVDLQSRLNLIKLNSKIKSYLPALDICNDGLDLDPGNEKLLFAKGELLFALMDYEEAKMLFNGLYQKDSTDIDCLWMLAKSAYLADDYMKAEQCLDSLYRYKKDDYLFNWYYGMANLKNRKYSKAERLLKEAILLATPYSLPVFYFQLGQAYRYQREFEKAIDAYQKALELNPMDYDLYYHIATTYEECESNKLIAYEWYNDYLDKCNGNCNKNFVRYSIDRVSKIKEQYFFEGTQLE